MILDTVSVEVTLTFACVMFVLGLVVGLYWPRPPALSPPLIPPAREEVIQGPPTFQVAAAPAPVAPEAMTQAQRAEAIRTAQDMAALEALCAAWKRARVYDDRTRQLVRLRRQESFPPNKDN